MVRVWWGGNARMIMRGRKTTRMRKCINTELLDLWELMPGNDALCTLVRLYSTHGHFAYERVYQCCPLD